MTSGLERGLASVGAQPNPGASRETAAGHIRNALHLLRNLLEYGSLNEEDRQDVQAAIRRLWRALREMERDEV